MDDFDTFYVRPNSLLEVIFELLQEVIFSLDDVERNAFIESHNKRHPELLISWRYSIPENTASYPELLINGSLLKWGPE